MSSQARKQSPTVRDDEIDLDDPRLIPPSMREKVGPTVAFAQLERKIADVQAGRAVGVDGTAFMER